MSSNVLIAVPPYRQRLAAIMAQEPDLTDFGLGISEGQDFEEEREKLRARLTDVAWTAWFLGSHIEHRKTINPERSSYGLKHLIEPLSPKGYLSNGAFIAAALVAGFSCKRIENTPNLAFGMSERSIKKVSRQARSMPRGGA